MPSLEGKVALITGAASGIGAATARLFVSEGARVVISDILDDRGQALASELGEAAVYAHADVTKEEEIAAALQVAVEQFGKLDCLVNNAGLAENARPIEELAAEMVDRTLAVLFRAVVLGMKHAAPIMKRQGSGNIVNMASVGGMMTGVAGHVYSGAKAGVIHLTRCVAMELAMDGIRVNSVCPGGMATPIFARSFGLSQDEAEEKLPVLADAMAHSTPLGRAGTPDDVARAVVWLASDASSFVTGHALVIDSGVHCGRGWVEQQSIWEDLRVALGAWR